MHYAAQLPEDVVLLHGCCHNPAGLDPSQDEWGAITDVLLERQLIPFIDMAYQGFAVGVDEDAFAVRYMAERLPEMIVSTSCSKNFGLYRDRVGTLSMMSADAATNKIVDSQVNNLVRTLYSMPPDHGGAVVSLILNDAELRASWLEELAAMRNRLQDMRRLLSETLQEKAPHHDFSHLSRAHGMFCFLGISAEQVARLKADHGVYMVDTSRVNLAGNYCRKRQLSRRVDRRHAVKRIASTSSIGTPSFKYSNSVISPMLRGTANINAAYTSPVLCSNFQRLGPSARVGPSNEVMSIRYINA